MKKFDVLLWDLDDTLLDFGQSEKHAIITCFQKFGIGFHEGMISRYSDINLVHWKKFERGEITKKDVLHGRFELFFKEFHIDGISPQEFQLLYQDELGSTYFYNDDSFELCKKLAKDFSQYIVTNGIVATQVKKLKLSGFDQIMDGIYISEQIGYQKPQIEFFDTCFQSIGDVKKERVLIIGDSLTSDMRGGNNAGIATCWYNPLKNDLEETVDIQYEIDSLNKIMDIVY